MITRVRVRVATPHADLHEIGTRHSGRGRFRRHSAMREEPELAIRIARPIEQLDGRYRRRHELDDRVEDLCVERLGVGGLQELRAQLVQALQRTNIFPRHSPPLEQPSVDCTSQAVERHEAG